MNGRGLAGGRHRVEADRLPEGIPGSNGSAPNSRSVVHRTMSVLDAFARRHAWGVRELAAYLGVSKSGLHRTLQEMLDEGMVRVDDNGMYVLGGKLLHLAASLINSVDLSRVGYESLVACRNGSGETTVLVTYDATRQQIVAIDCLESTHPVHFSWGALREWTDLHLSASGKAILAFLPRAEQERYFANKRLDKNGRSVTLAKIRPELREIKAAGWSASHGARVPHTSGVASPIFDARGRVVGGIVICWPNLAERTDELQIGYMCASEALATSRRLGWWGKEQRSETAGQDGFDLWSARSRHPMPL